MEGKYIALIIVGTVVPAAVIGGLLGGMYYINTRKKQNMRLNILFLSLMPAEFTIEITSNADWSGYYSSGYSYNFISGSGDEIYRTTGLDATTCIWLDSAGYLTVRLRAFGKTIVSKTTTITSSYVCLSGSSPWRNLIFLIFLI